MAVVAAKEKDNEQDAERLTDRRKVGLPGCLTNWRTDLLKEQDGLADLLN